MADNRDYTEQNRGLVSRESAKLDRARSKAEALKRNATKKLAQSFKDSNAKGNILKEALEATRRRESGERSIFDRLNEFGYIDEKVTGNEDRPWETDFDE